MVKTESTGKIYRISGPVVIAIGLEAKMYDLVKVGKEQLMGEVIQISGDKVTIQVYENTIGLTPGEPVSNTGEPLSVELGPGLLEQIYDGIQRPLRVLKDKSGDFIGRGISADGLDHEKKWDFVPVVKKGDSVSAGDVLGNVQETKNTLHKILVPPNMKGKIKEIKSGKFNVIEGIGKLEDGTILKLAHKWPVRQPRPCKEKLRPTIPLITGQRILDTLFPMAKGGSGAIPGGFGTGKTVTQQQLSKWSDAQIVVYIGCGERGNEMTEVLTEFPHLQDVRTGRPLMERTVLIANTSNMPVAAREASVYTGMTIAEYYRDQGFDVSLMADSTSRWAEAMREISSRLEEMPGEEGYPAYLASRLAEFYERTGRVKCLGEGKGREGKGKGNVRDAKESGEGKRKEGEGNEMRCGEWKGNEGKGKEKMERIGSVTAVGAVSPPGGDFSEPVTQNTLKVTKVFWALDSRLAQRRHFPAINWLNSYSLYSGILTDWYIENVSKEWPEIRKTAMQLLQKEDELQEIVQLVGSDALPEKERLVLETAKLIREGFLQQNAYHDVDSYCSPTKQFKILKSIISFYHRAQTALKEDVPVETIVGLKSLNELVKAGFIPEKEFDSKLSEIEKKIESEFMKILSKKVEE